MPAMLRVLMTSAAVGALCATASSAQNAGQINVGITVSQTGPAAALGIPQKNSVA